VWFALAVVALAYFYRLDRPLFWADEADTGILARNILRYGYPGVFDGRNVRVFINGIEINQRLVRTVMPWSQFYVGALSLAIFGNHTAGVRILFVLLGLVTFFPLYAVFKTRVKCPALITALVLLAPQTVLFQRSARYYPMLILAYAILAWDLATGCGSSKRRWVVAGLVMTALFQTHSFAAICCAVSVILFCVLFRREALPRYLLASALGLVLWFTWSRLIGPSVEPHPWVIASGFSSWCNQVLAGLWAVPVDLDAVGCLPLLFWTLACFVLLRQGREVVLKLVREPAVSFFCLSLLVHAVGTAAVVGTETNVRYAVLRYMPHVIVLGLAAAFCALDGLIRTRSLYLLACVFIVACNLLTISFWTGIASRRVPISWVPPVYGEILRPQATALDTVIDQLRAEATVSPKPDTVMIVLPDWVQDTMIFYLGDSYLVRPMLREPRAPAFDHALRNTLGKERYRQLFARPEWIVDIEGDIEPAAGYTNAGTFPSYRDRPDDGTRPELTRHTFPQPDVVRNVVLFRASRSR
jgi:hypothetical protein